MKRIPSAAGRGSACRKFPQMMTAVYLLELYAPLMLFALLPAVSSGEENQSKDYLNDVRFIKSETERKIRSFRTSDALRDDGGSGKGNFHRYSETAEDRVRRDSVTGDGKAGFKATDTGNRNYSYSAYDESPRKSGNNRNRTVKIYVNSEMPLKHLRLICSQKDLYEPVFRDMPAPRVLSMLISSGCSFSVNPFEFAEKRITMVPYTDDYDDRPSDVYGAALPETALDAPPDLVCRDINITDNIYSGDSKDSFDAIYCGLKPDAETESEFNAGLENSRIRIIRNLKSGNLPPLNR